jgi:hypothetical protein
MTKPKRIVLITTGQPASNPRLVKEADALVNAGYEVQVLYSYWAPWAQEVDKTILPQAGWTGRLCGGSPQDQPWVYFWTRLRRKVSALLPDYLPAIRRAFCRSYDELLSAALKSKADLYIAHNLGALPVAAEAARRNSSLYAFDAEDYHRGEQDTESPFFTQVSRLEDRYLPGTVYRSAASPMIAEAYQKVYSGMDFHVLLNTFPLALQPAFRKGDSDKPLKLFWFSQTIGLDRGLQELIKALDLLPDVPVEVALLGNVSTEIRHELEEGLQHQTHTINFYGPDSEGNLFQLSANCDIGLGLERSTPHNRDICLTNKIFVYLLAGNALILSETSAQKQFLETYPFTGRSYPIGNHQQMANIIASYHDQRNNLERDRMASWDLGNSLLNWDYEQQKFLKLILSVL